MQQGVSAHGPFHTDTGALNTCSDPLQYNQQMDKRSTDTKSTASPSATHTLPFALTAQGAVRLVARQRSMRVIC